MLRALRWNAWSLGAARFRLRCCLRGSRSVALLLCCLRSEGVRLLRSATEDAFASVREEIESVVVTVSGGLDSSIVGALAAKHFRQVTFLTFFTADPYGDERPFARALAEGKGEVPGHGWDDAAEVMAILDEMRTQIGLVFPGEQNE